MHNLRYDEFITLDEGPAREEEMTSEKHEQHHQALAQMQDRIDRMWKFAYDRAKVQRLHAPRQFATRSVRSQRVTQIAAWRSHLYSAHGVKTISPFASLVELQTRHAELHKAVQ